MTPCKRITFKQAAHESLWLQALAPVREGLERHAGEARRGAGRAGRAAQPRTTAQGELLPNQLVSLEPSRPRVCFMSLSAQLRWGVSACTLARILRSSLHLRSSSVQAQCEHLPGLIAFAVWKSLELV